jgi:hypothetical protein
MTPRGKANKSYIHGRSNTPEFRSWSCMLSRCYDPKHHAARNYSKRGITVCAAWRKSFMAFFEYVGPRPGPGYSIERIRNSEGYKPGNVKWATRSEQSNNKRNNHTVTYRGETMTLMQAIRKSNSPHSFQAVWYRLAAGWPVDHALEAPKYARPTG